MNLYYFLILFQPTNQSGVGVYVVHFLTKSSYPSLHEIPPQEVCFRNYSKNVFTDFCHAHTYSNGSKAVIETYCLNMCSTGEGEKGTYL